MNTTAEKSPDFLLKTEDSVSSVAHAPLLNTTRLESIESLLSSLPKRPKNEILSQPAKAN